MMFECAPAAVSVIMAALAEGARQAVTPAMRAQARKAADAGACGKSVGMPVGDSRRTYSGCWVGWLTGGANQHAQRGGQQLCWRGYSSHPVGTTYNKVNLV